ncbi:DUF2917 domain-containing protein [Chitinimonas koreensis]|uniref:DUF2917 domain-containing protein n=1 Tax=Chitinimonas koreensis TaxID=356302 RepID=UPI000425B59E|nr:DUF2917 domain-containing protein [Chitinimonas koreensis]QNM97990.1 DUF2917 domain-containing protein [Chitinimonas koreensis]
MLYQFIEYEQRLARDQVLSLDSVDGFRIVVREGGLWLTEDDGPDVILQAGEQYRLHGRGKVVLQAIDGARLALPKLAASGPWQRIRALFAAADEPAAPCNCA